MFMLVYKNTSFFYRSDEEETNIAKEEKEASLEEGEIHPLVSVTKIDPDEIPEVILQIKNLILVFVF